MKTRRGSRAISELVVAVLLVIVGIIAVLVFFGHLIPVIGGSAQDLIIQPDSKIVTMGNMVKLILHLKNTDGKITVKKIEIETDKGQATCDNVNAEIRPKSDVTIEKVVAVSGNTQGVNAECNGATADDFGGKDTYTIIIYYEKGGSEYSISGEVYYGG